jgi:hypothetical protein
MPSRLARTLLVAVAAVALAAAGIGANFLLLRYADANNDPVGKLTPRATITQPSSPPTTQTVDHTDGSGEGEERDD